MCQVGPRWRPNREIAWHTERLQHHVRIMYGARIVSVLLCRHSNKNDSTGSESGSIDVENFWMINCF